MRLVLASASPARLATLRAAGFAPDVVVSDVDEDAVLLTLADGARVRDATGAGAGNPVSVPASVVPAADQVLALARAKARDVAARIAARTEGTGGVPGSTRGADGRAGADGVLAGGAPGDVLVVGCDSMLEMDSPAGRVVVGKPGTPQRAVERWRQMRGRSATLHTGHWLVRADPAARTGAARSGAAPAAATRAQVGAVSSTVVHFADLDDAEIEAYVATGEPLHVAGAFTIDGLGGPFVERIEGDHHGVVGLSLPLLRTLAAQVGVRLTDLWT